MTVHQLGGQPATFFVLCVCVFFLLSLHRWIWTSTTVSRLRSLPFFLLFFPNGRCSLRSLYGVLNSFLTIPLLSRGGPARNYVKVLS